MVTKISPCVNVLFDGFWMAICSSSYIILILYCCTCCSHYRCLIVTNWVVIDLVVAIVIFLGVKGTEMFISILLTTAISFFVFFQVLKFSQTFPQMMMVPWTWLPGSLSLPLYPNGFPVQWVSLMSTGQRAGFYHTYTWVRSDGI